LRLRSLWEADTSAAGLPSNAGSNIGLARLSASNKIDGLIIVEFLFTAHGINVAICYALQHTLFNWLQQW
jgi:hypothetical protein